MPENQMQLGVDIQHLHTVVFSLLDARAFSSATRILESLFGLGDCSPTMQLAYATCLIETGHGRQVSALLDRLKEGLDQSAGGGSTKLRDALSAIRERLPGGRWDPARLDSLQSDAVRMIPILRK